MKTDFHGRMILAAALALAAALPARAASSDDDYAAALGSIRKAMVTDVAAMRKQNLFRLATQETGPNDPLLLMQKPLIDLVKKVEPSVVFLMMELPEASAQGLPKTAAPAPGAPKKKHGSSALCTGFFVDAAPYLGRGGIIATNAHCVEKMGVGAEITVGLYDNNDNRPKMTKGKVLAYGNSDSAKDLAFVELTDPSLNRRGLPLWWKLDVGEQVVAIGNPLGMTFSVTKGIISALDRDTLEGHFILEGNQSDVAVNPGNSGGPLFNMWGSVVGINTMIASQSGGFEGISVSVPANYVAEGLKQYARTGNLKIGSLQVALGASEAGGKLAFQSVAAGGPAAAAQLKEKDELLRVDGVDVAGMPLERGVKSVVAHVKYMSPGEIVNLVIRRDGREMNVAVTLGEPPPPVEPRPEWAPIPPKPKKQSFPGFGQATGVVSI